MRILETILPNTVFGLNSMFAEIPNRFKEVIVIGKIMILRFLDKEKQIIE